MHRSILGRVSAKPGFFGGEAQDWRQPRGQAREALGQYGPGRAGAQAVGRVAVERILADIEVERGQVDGTEVVQLGIQPVEVVGLRRSPYQRVQLRAEPLAITSSSVTCLVRLQEFARIGHGDTSLRALLGWRQQS